MIRVLRTALQLFFFFNDSIEIQILSDNRILIIVNVFFILHSFLRYYPSTKHKGEIRKDRTGTFYVFKISSRMCMII